MSIESLGVFCCFGSHLVLVEGVRINSCYGKGALKLVAGKNEMDCRAGNNLSPTLRSKLIVACGKGYTTEGVIGFDADMITAFRG